jgi:maltose/moltooligosaccharide transporter
MKKKPTLNFWQIWNMSFGFLGIQFGFALQNANVSRIFQTLGAEIDDLAILWVAAPVTGLIVQPIIGYFSDRTWMKLGRRRPYFLAGAILASVALFIMPNSPTLWIAAGMLWIMDASINISMEPFRAFVGDNLSEEQRDLGFAMQSFFIGTGAVIASLLPGIMADWFGVQNTAAEGIIPDSVKFSFYIGGAVFLLAVLWTVFRSTEYSPEEMAEFEGEKETSYKGELSTKEEYAANGKLQRNFSIPIILVSIALLYWVSNGGLHRDLYIFVGLIFTFGLLLLIAGMMQVQGNYNNGFVSGLNDFQFMPKTMKQLAVVQFFSWFGLFAMFIYLTPAVTEHIYKVTDTTSELYNEGANMVGYGYAWQNGTAALIAFLLPVLARKLSRKLTHSICLAIGGLGLASILLIDTPNMFIVTMIAMGVAWSSILSMPYSILTGSIPSNKMGYYMGVFNFFIVIPQIIAAALLGFVLNQFFEGNAVYAMLIGGVSFLIAAVMTLFVDDKK